MKEHTKILLNDKLMKNTFRWQNWIVINSDQKMLKPGVLMYVSEFSVTTTGLTEHILALT